MGNALEASRPPTRHVGGRAFTFIEILATMALLAIVLPAVMTGISLCLSTAGLAKQQAQASSLGHSKLMELVAGGQWQQTSLAGDFGDQWPDYRWAAQVSNWDGTVLRELDLTVSWRHQGKDRNVMLSTLVYTGAQQ